MFGIKNFLFRGATMAATLPDDVREALAAWQQAPEPALNEAHFHVRYVVVDVTTTGGRLEQDLLLGVSAVGVSRGGEVQPDDAVSLNFSGMENDSDAVDRQLMAFLQFVGKAPLVVYHSPLVLGFLQRAYRERLGIDLQPANIDLAWLLPNLFDEKSSAPAPLDQWLEWFGMTSDGRRDAMTNTLVLARLFQRLLVRAAGKSIDTAARLLEESSASSYLRRSH